MLILLFAIVILCISVPSVLSLRRPVFRVVSSTRSTFSRTLYSLFLRRTELFEQSEKDGGGRNEKAELSRPPIIMFDDFARADIIQPSEDSKQPPQHPRGAPRGGMDELVSSETRQAGPRKRNSNDLRPTGYNTPDEIDDNDYSDDDEDEDEDKMLNDYVLTRPNRGNPILKFLKDTYIGSPYDSRRKKQARSVIRNISGISVVIGIVFTGMWYLFPGQFISYRGNTDFTQRYSQSYIDPDDLLHSDAVMEDMEYFDDGQGIPDTEATRFAPPRNEPARAPGRSVDL